MGLRQRGEAPEEPTSEVHEESETKDSPEKPHAGHDCCRNFLSSRPWKCITMIVVGFTPVFGVMVAMPKLLMCLGVESGRPSWFLNYCFGAWISTQFLYNFIATQWTDAGGCKDLKPPHEVTGQFALGGEGSKFLYAPNWCTKCLHWKPPRSHHCRSSGRCVLRMDHFCPFTGNCIGARNHGHFILFYVFAFIGLMYSLVLSLGAAYSTDHISRWTDNILPKYKESQGSVQKHFLTGMSGLAVAILLEVLMKKGLEVMIQLVATSLALVAVLATGIPACQLAWSNVTTMERLFPMKEYVQLKDQIYCPLGPGFYRQKKGIDNLKVILGERWWMRLLLPVPGRLSVSDFVAPLPSQEGCEALEARLKQVEEQGVKQEVKSCRELGFDPGPESAV